MAANEFKAAMNRASLREPAFDPKQTFGATLIELSFPIQKGYKNENSFLIDRSAFFNCRLFT